MGLSGGVSVSGNVSPRSAWLRRSKIDYEDEFEDDYDWSAGSCTMDIVGDR